MISNLTLALVISVFGLACAIKIQHYHHDLSDHHEELEHYEPIEHYAAVEHKEKHHIIPIIKHEFKQSKDGYSFSYEGGNGIHAEESGYVKDSDEKHGSLVQKGSISYHDEHGHPIHLTYIADEHGFRPQGDHLPTPPPLPIEHLKAIAEHNAHNAHSGHQEEVSQYGGGEELHHHYGHL